ncbi:MAG: porin family protein [Dysgonamonadaceae bacterium]|nr:porin family protein [Dysgonamonadaceae bacterium]
MKQFSILYRLKAFWILFFIYLITCATAVAQEYKYEIGGGLGASMYMGDANQGDFFQGLHPSFGAVFRKNMDLRWAVKADLSMGTVSGDTRKVSNVFPGNAQASFSRSFYELGGQMEFNFLPYSDKFPYLGAKKISPYIFAGLGLTYASGGNQSFFGLNLPLGVGVKYKIKKRINLGLEYGVRKLFQDDFDAPGSEGFNLDNPYKIPTGWAKNNDWYSVLMFTVTWDFGSNSEKCTTPE